jgi:6-hydroxycyclohex-1-ene-1-carbonyl-CoA dehydrogenase
MDIRGWTVIEPGRPMVEQRRAASPGAGEVAVEVAGCGVCHTDLGYYYDGVPTRSPFPLTLGHEISGTVVEAGDGSGDWLGKRVVVPAVIPCGDCPACNAGRGSVCPRQIFPGNDVHGGFATHAIVPSRGLCPVPDLDDPQANPRGIDLAALSVIADAVSTPYQALENAGLAAGDLAVFVGVGGVGGFGIQLAAARGAHVVGIDVDAERLELLGRHGAALTLRADELSFKELRGAVREFAEEKEAPSWRWRIFETSGTPEGQATAYGLVAHGTHLGVVGFTARKVELRLSNLMAFDATARGTWGCLPEHYPAIVDAVLAGRVAVEPFTERRPLSSINRTFEDVHARRVKNRVVLIPGS